MATAECTPSPAPISESPRPTAIAMNPRCLTISYFQPVTERAGLARNPPPMPYLRLLGRWLERAGFTVGAKVRVNVEARRLVLEVIELPSPPPPRSVRPSRLARFFRSHPTQTEAVRQD
jgi:hypothetical protein